MNEDDDLARAIALSLQEANDSARSRRQSYHTEHDNGEEAQDDEERRFQENLRRATEASKHEQARNATSPAAMRPTSGAATRSFLVDRAQLEKERLARQKRLRPQVEMRDHDYDDDEVDGHKAKRQHVSLSAAVRCTNKSASSSIASRNAPVASGSNVQISSKSTGTGDDGCFWDGELRQTANMHTVPAKDTRPTFRLTEILAPKDDIEFAIVSAYVFNFPWLYDFFSRTTPVIVVAQDSQGQATLKAILPEWVKTTPFLRNGMGCMHMKFMLLFYRSGRLRIVVSTANMIPYDWRDIENSAWVQDVPKRRSPIRHDPKADDFAAALVRVLRSINVGPALDNQLKNDHPNLPLKSLEEIRTNWDFSKVKARLIASIAGKHEGWPSVVSTGHTALMKAIRDMDGKADKGKEIDLECQGSSIGTYSTQWMNEFYCSARGESAQTWLDTPKTRRAKLPYPPVKILFPTKQYVQESKLGEPGGGTMFCRRNQWEAAKFPRELFHQSRSKRGGVLMHSKMILGLYRRRSGTDTHSYSESEDEDDNEKTQGANKLLGWLYVGSHNFTPSAWGTLSGSAFNPTLNIMNYELGVLFPLRSEEEVAQMTCWERPPKKYVLGTDEPWIQSESPAFVLV
ncbi:phospholipase D/nuclease [Wolfiporia cocos MD-104 SS10]|uniref:Phospholipase D/nuclease n=1 Tax=Wolfiporia cocos (strain MD-104) TaxID=742152 RepID=A0A2H3K4D8_WOLCO|nr:phospholipase D/nuclease [Wolfiporia cocos MD-104 SS10]